MKMMQRVLLASTILLVDLVAVIVPLTALIMAYVIVFNPPWFKAFMESLDG